MPLTLLISLIVVGSLLVLILSFLILDGFVFFNITFRRRPGDKDFAKNENPKEKNAPDRLWYFSQNPEELNLVSYDKLNLKGYYLNNRSNKLAILIHGYHGRYYSLVSQAKVFIELGYDVLNINNRCHDTSEGRYLTMGEKESRDLIDWIRLMLKRNPSYRIVLYGISMGSHITMLSLGRKEIDPRVKCAILDCGYFSLKDQLIYTLKYNKYFWPSLHVNAGRVVAKLFYHFSFHKVASSLGNSMVPMMFIHGDKDDYVPFVNLNLCSTSASRSIYTEVHEFKGANHTQCIKQYETFKQLTEDFTKRFIQ